MQDFSQPSHSSSRYIHLMMHDSQLVEVLCLCLADAAAIHLHISPQYIPSNFVVYHSILRQHYIFEIMQMTGAVLRDTSGCDAIADQVLSSLQNRQIEAGLGGDSQSSAGGSWEDRDEVRIHCMFSSRTRQFDAFFYRSCPS